MAIHRLTVALVLAVDVLSTGPNAVIPARHELLNMLQRKAPAGVDPAFECDWRGLAYSFAAKIQPFRPASAFQNIFDGLELGSLCNQTFSPPANAVAVSTSKSAHVAATVLYVDPVNGDDSFPGTLQQPLQHVAVAVQKARGAPRPASVILRDGVHRLTSTLQLGAEDSGLSIAAYPGEAPVISGGYALKTAWAPYNVSSEPSNNAQWVVQTGENNMWGQWPSSVISNASTAASADVCQALCDAAANSTSNPCQGFIWYDPKSYGSPWGGICFLRRDAVYAPTAQAGVTSGYRPAPPVPQNVWVSDLGSAGTPLPLSVVTTNEWVLTLLVSDDGGRSPQRAFRARFPNADPETDLFPAGWAAGGARITSAPNMDTQVINISVPGAYTPSMFDAFYWGTGGPCDRFQTEPLGSYWCQPNGRVAGAEYFVNSPEGLLATPGILPHAPYTSGVAQNGGTLNYWRSGHWFTQHTRLAGATTFPNGSTLLSWSYGAFQGAEGDANGEDWSVEHVFEELDAPREFYFDGASQRLFYFHNASSGTPPPQNWTFEAPLLTTLINISGSQAAPVTDITISGVTFTSAAASLLGPHGIPSGGDWGLARAGAVFLQGTERVTITDSLFTRCDGSGVFISGYNRNATVTRSEFAWMGENGVASWGYANNDDATDGNYPSGSVVSDNICRQIGMLEKQVSCYFGGISMNAVISGNVMFNMPRAAVNFNDGAGGNNALEGNLIWNTCLESQDHGPFNSWDRVPYLTTNRNGTPTAVPADNIIAANFFVAGGGANGGCWDNDDGSSFYAAHDNFCVYGGHKSDFDGHAKRSVGNLFAYANVYGARCLSISLPLADPTGLWAEGFVNNTCVLADAGDTYLNMDGCSPTDPTFGLRMLVGNNSVYAPGADVMVSCGKSMPFSQWQAYGLDKGTTVGDAPASATIIGWAAALLGLPQPA